MQSVAPASTNSPVPRRMGESGKHDDEMADMTASMPTYLFEWPNNADRHRQKSTSVTELVARDVSPQSTGRQRATTPDARQGRPRSAGCWPSRLLSLPASSSAVSDDDEEGDSGVGGGCAVPRRSPSKGSKSPRLSALVTSRNLRWSDTQLARTDSGDKDPAGHSPKTSKSRSEQFARLFPEIDDQIINSYHCAFIGDILFQGILFVTRNWFCFHSKLLGKKSIKIPVSSVTEIVKMNMAMIIPNAVGIYTDAEKYVFGSLIARRSTFRLLYAVWQEHSATTNNNKIFSTSISENTSSSTSQGDQQTLGSSDDATSCGADDTVDDIAPCRLRLNGMSIDSPASVADDDGGQPADEVEDDAEEEDDDPTATQSLADSDQTTGRPVTEVRRPGTQKVGGGGSRTVDQKAATCRERRPATAPNGGQPSRRGSFGGPSTTTAHAQRAVSGTVATRKSTGGRLQRSSFFLVIFTVTVIILTFMAVYLAYKLIHLQARIDAYTDVWSSNPDGQRSGEFRDSGDADVYRLRHEEHISAVERLRTIIETHIRLLDKVNQSLKGLCHITPEGARINMTTDDDVTQVVNVTSETGRIDVT